MNMVAVIPARYASSRFPGKPLALLCGRPVIEHTYRRVSAAVDRVVVATDDVRIADAVHAFGGKAVLTSPSHSSGTSRVLEAVELWAPDADLVINVQGDEPLLPPSLLGALVDRMQADPEADIATPVRVFDPAEGFGALSDANAVKVVTDAKGRALYFSRSVIPAVRGAELALWPTLARYLIHMGVYAFRADVLRHVCSLPPCPLEAAENLEQLGWLAAGARILTVETDARSVGIDTPADLEAAARILAEQASLQK